MLLFRDRLRSRPGAWSCMNAPSVSIAARRWAYIRDTPMQVVVVEDHRGELDGAARRWSGARSPCHLPANGAEDG